MKSSMSKQKEYTAYNKWLNFLDPQFQQENCRSIPLGYAQLSRENNL